MSSEICLSGCCCSDNYCREAGEGRKMYDENDYVCILEIDKGVEARITYPEKKKY